MNVFYFYIACAVCAAAVCLLFSASDRPLRFGVASTLLGACAYLLLSAQQSPLCLLSCSNPVSAAVSVLLGLPGVILLLVCGAVL